VLAGELAALDGRAAEAAGWIDRAVAAGWKRQGIVMEPHRDPVFAPVRSDPAFAAAVARYRASIAAEAARYRSLGVERVDWTQSST